MKDFSVKLRVSFQQDARRFFGPGICELLERTRDAGSIRAAALQMNMAYSKASRILKEAQCALGFSLLESNIGGVGGGGSRLTLRGEAFIHQYRSLQRDLQEQADALLQHYFFSNENKMPQEENS